MHILPSSGCDKHRSREREQTVFRKRMPRVSDWLPWTPRRALKVMLTVVLIPTMICGPASRWAWPEAWIVALLPLLLLLLPAALYINEHNPGLFDERERFLRNSGIAGFDKVLAPVVVSLLIPMYLAAGLQHHYTPGSLLQVTPAMTAAAFAVDALAISWQCWSMCANHWFSSVVRIQTDRGHQVCSQGPYAFVRHPAYVAVLFEHMAEAVLLQSGWFLVLGLLRAALFAVRAAAEDAWLQEHLPGYAAYAAKVKYRWLPYVW